jgi:shikimate kinase
LQQDDPGAVLERLLKVRRPLYEQADIVLETSGESADHVTENAIKALCAYLDPRTK